ncbi:mannose-6-phosphate isomerase-like protein (cupin superfamily) [Catalinimonas alkaloidigena]|uniref:cupin domain-containing protein n=1 Tax=Catalinimonas alkaloidigena TaxID=1075417 RepID=UPI0024050AEA|nr:cupin domain-containing protein [Catalinimonas alkaloidigena]MDF9796606.1 mannose-6-phosphate isomerase-like protein (cupin superfamily) [Catalinimonas alkaloidigena]
MKKFKLSPFEAISALHETDEVFKTLFEHGSLSVEIYKPNTVDHQKPHMRDEIYVIISGSGKFKIENKTVSFTPGDFLFVPAGMKHRFFDFSDDFSTWVFFYGPEGGEAHKSR